LCVDGERAQGHVSVLWIENHVFDNGDFSSRHLTGRSTWARGTVIPRVTVYGW